MRKDSLLHNIREGIQDMCYIWAREMRSTVKDEGVLIFFILVPLLYPLLYSWIYNNQVVREVPVAVVDLSHSEQSRAFIRQYDAAPDVNVASHCSNLDEAKQLIGKQAVKGIVYIPANFTDRINRHEQATIGIYCDMSIMLNYKAIYQTATSVISKINAGIQLAGSRNFTKRDEQITIQPLDFTEVPIFNSTGGYANFIIPGVLMLILHQTLLLGIGLAAGTARENNRYRDLIPVSRHYNGLFRIVLGKSLCYFMVYCVMAAYLALAVPRIFGFVQIIEGRDLLGLMVPYLLSTIFFGMMLSCTIHYRENVMLLVVFTSIPLLFLSGISWPQSNIPGVWQAIAYIFPSTFGIRGFVRLNTMGATLADIRPEYQMLWTQVIVYFFTTCAVYRYQIIQSRRHAVERLNAIKAKVTRAKTKK